MAMTHGSRAPRWWRYLPIEQKIMFPLLTVNSIAALIYGLVHAL